MAQDDQPPPAARGPPPGATAPPAHVGKPQIHEIFHGPGQGAPAAPGQPPPTIRDGIQSIKRDDFFGVHRIPCARQAFMTGIVAGTVAGFGRYLVGAPANRRPRGATARIPKAANWAFGTFFVASIGQWEYCRAQRASELVAMARVVEVIDRKQAEKKAETARLQQEAAEKLEREAAAKRKSWYKFW
ncbi:hypothetical protein GGS23DRAFT_596168 [Durotheca rogersii]|uniref:uncharacterized protein n=1 Tax=Durotheca rogersii TaxID=419775 RepID=UPI0022207D97|nr:uncharacterized protein GGS23DRAFT_596168 [Durotheca rogersii]KAI5863662.1 hypothetical protein GGS23DRAFT_596168 [Durotheca rogersii]